MSTGRFISLLVCGLLAAVILALPSWLQYWDAKNKAGPTLGQLSHLMENTEYWNAAGYKSIEATHTGEVKVTTRLFKSMVIKEPAGGPKEQMMFAQVVVENDSPAPVYIYEVEVHGFNDGVRVFRIPVSKTTNHAEGLTASKVPRVFDSEGMFIPAYLLNDKISASVLLTNAPVNVKF